jgi:hypothetical protein
MKACPQHVHGWREQRRRDVRQQRARRIIGQDEVPVPVDRECRERGVTAKNRIHRLPCRSHVGLVDRVLGMDRPLIAILIEPMKRDLALSDSEMGLLTGLGFALFYATMGLPIAILADRADRRLVLAVSSVLEQIALNLQHIVIASEARQSSFTCGKLDCRVASLLAMTIHILCTAL